MRHFYLNPEAAFERMVREYTQYGSLVIAVDFDNTLYDYHQQGLDCSEIIDLLNELKRINCSIVIWTASEQVEFIQTYCDDRGIPIDGINSNPTFFQSNSRKIYYNELLDDRAGLAESFHRLMRLVEHVNLNRVSHAV